MRITFEAVNIRDLVLQMEHVIASFSPKAEVSAPQAPGFGTVPKDIVPVDRPTTAAGRAALARAEAEVAAMAAAVDKPVDKPVEKRARTEKQLANDEKMRVAALARIADRKAVKAAAVEKSVEKPVEKLVEETPDPFVQEPEEVDPAELVQIRQKTIEELQVAYGNGHHKEVMELLSRFGNGAKSFRELKPEAFMPIRKAIDLGALE